VVRRRSFPFRGFFSPQTSFLSLFVPAADAFSDHTANDEDENNWNRVLHKNSHHPTVGLAKKSVALAVGAQSARWAAIAIALQFRRCFHRSQRDCICYTRTSIGLLECSLTLKEMANLLNRYWPN